MRRVAVIDSSPLIYLSHLGLAEKLSLYFDRIYVPRGVQIEVNRKQKFRHRLNKLYKTGLFEKCLSADRTVVDLHRINRLGTGEAEGLAQAQEREAHFFIADETRARQVSELQGFVPVGTLRLIARLALEGHALDARHLAGKLKRDLNARIGDAVVEQAIASATVPI